MTELVVLIPTAGGNPALERTLQSLNDCNKPFNYLKTIVVENGPKFQAEDICKKFPLLKIDYRYVEMANKSNALNEVIKSLDDSALIFFTDDDARFDRNVLAKYSEASKGKSSGEFYGGPVRVDYERIPPKWYRGYLPPSALGWTYNENARFDGVSGFLGINWAAFVKDIKETGFFDTTIGPGAKSFATGQEFNMQMRLFQKGVKPIYNSNAIVWHYVPKSKSTFSWAVTRKYRNGISQGLRIGDIVEIRKVKKNFWIAFWLVVKNFLMISRTNMIKHVFRASLEFGKLKGIKLANEEVFRK